MSIYRTRNGTNLNTIKNSLSDMLPNKSVDSLERSKFEQSQQASLAKAINIIESPVKEKHIRNIILGTCYERSATPFWYGAIKLQLHGNAILCWKFCYVLHKLLRDGHSSTAQDSFQFVPNLEDLAKSWVHLKQGYGIILFHYLNYLVFKVKFHKKNQLIPGNLMIEDKDLVELAANNVDTYFQLCCDFFDYLDEILALQNSIFVTMDRSRSNSMTESGQLKLAPLVLCIQESNQLYDFCVKFLFKLHDNLPSDILEGHRQRFLNIFKELAKFYECCRNLQYFKGLISIPELPPVPPNFRQISEFSAYVKPVATVVEQPINDSLIDDSDSILVDFSDQRREESHALNSSASSANNDLQQLQLQQYLYSQGLLQEIDRLRLELERVASQSTWEINELKEQNKALADQLSLCRTELEQQKIRSASLEEQMKISRENEQAKQAVESLERKATSSEEKFNKMKELYGKLKDQHVGLLRQEAEVRKQKLSLAEECEHGSKTRLELQNRLDEAVGDKNKFEASMQERLNELQAMRSDREKLQAENLNQNLNYQEQIKTLKEGAHKASSDQKKLYQRIYSGNFETSISVVNDALQLFEDPVLLNCKSGAEYLLQKLHSFSANFNEMVAAYKQILAAESRSQEDVEDYTKLFKFLSAFTLSTSDCVVFGKIISLTAADLEQGKDLADLCQNFGSSSLGFLEKMHKKEELSEAETLSLTKSMTKVHMKLTDLLPKVHDINKDEIGDLIDQEMHKTSEAIESAVVKLEALLSKSREQETGVKLEVNDKILDSCTSLMKAIKVLIIKAQDLQKEIVAQGRGASSVKEFYSKNHKWTEGLVSAAKLVGVGANFLIDKTDKLVNGDGSLEEIIVCSNEIAASTAQLVVSSNVKANRESQNRIALIDAKTNVSNATANLVATAKSCSQIIDEKSSMDFSNISLHQTKMLEMEAQVAVIHLEKQLEDEKKKLYELRKQHYKNDTTNGN